MTLNLDFTAEQLRGITAAREAHNANPTEGSPAPFESNESYVVWVIARAADSYAAQYPA